MYRWLIGIFFIAALLVLNSVQAANNGNLLLGAVTMKPTPTPTNTPMGGGGGEDT